MALRAQLGLMRATGDSTAARAPSALKALLALLPQAVRRAPPAWRARLRVRIAQRELQTPRGRLASRPLTTSRAPLARRAHLKLQQLALMAPPALRALWTLRALRARRALQAQQTS